jgi:hypothetical protein
VLQQLHEAPAHTNVLVIPPGSKTPEINMLRLRTSYNHVPGGCYQVPSAKRQVPGIRYGTRCFEPGPEYESGIRHQVPVTRHHGLVTKHQMLVEKGSGAKCLVSRARCQLSGAMYSVPGAR